MALMLAAKNYGVDSVVAYELAKYPDVLRKHAKTELQLKKLQLCLHMNYLSSSTAAWAAARRAIGTRNGEQEA